MAGILNKKSRIIDYKLTENGRKQIQNGDINFKYYTLSDSSIVYSKSEEESDVAVSSSEYNYLPFEISTDPFNYINPEFNLTDEVSFNNNNTELLRQTTTEVNAGSFLIGTIYEIIEQGTTDFTLIGSLNNDIGTKFTATGLGSGSGKAKLEVEHYKFLDLNTSNSVIDKIIDKKYLNHKDLIDDKVFFTFKEKSVKKEFDFNSASNNFILSYPTINSLRKDITDIENINNDFRFSHKTNYKVLPPVNTDGSKISEEDSNISYGAQNPLKSVYKSLSTNTGIDIDDNRKTAIVKVINSLSALSDHDIFKNFYILNEKSELKSHLFEMHEIKENYGSEISISQTTLQEGAIYRIERGFGLTREVLSDLGFENADNYYSGDSRNFVAKGTSFERFTNNITTVVQVFEELIKLAFVNLGEFYNEKIQKNCSIFLIGKIIHNEKSYNRSNIELDYNSTAIKRNISTDYSFINLFTLVLEK